MKTLISKKLTKAQTALLQQYEVDYDCVPFMRYTLAFNESEIKDLLALPNATWIFTSKRGVDAIVEPLRKSKAPQSILTVGKNAANKLADLGFQVDFVANTSEDIVNYLKENKIQKVIYFRGRYFRNTIPAFCKANGINYEDAECYHATQNDFDIDIQSYDSIWIFSPINAKIASQLEGIQMHMKVYSIGPVTTKSLDNAGFTNIETPNQPSFEKVLDLYLSNQKNK